MRRRVKSASWAAGGGPASARQAPNVADVEVLGGWVVASVDGAEPAIADIVAHLVGAGVGILGVEQERNELERIFLEVTRGEMQ